MSADVISDRDGKRMTERMTDGRHSVLMKSADDVSIQDCIRHAQSKSCVFFVCVPAQCVTLTRSPSL